MQNRIEKLLQNLPNPQPVLEIQFESDSSQIEIQITLFFSSYKAATLTLEALNSEFDLGLIDAQIERNENYTVWVFIFDFDPANLPSA